MKNIKFIQDAADTWYIRLIFGLIFVFVGVYCTFFSEDTFLTLSKIIGYAVLVSSLIELYVILAHKKKKVTSQGSLMFGFIDLAIAQIAGLGLIICNMLFHAHNYYITQLIIISFAILASIFFYYIEKQSPEQQEAIIGCSFIISASLAILLLANTPHGDEKMGHLLSGQILFVTWGDILKHIPIYIFIILTWFLRPKTQNNIGFYLLFALAIASSVQLVGIYVVFASLILPALTAIKHKKPLLISWINGILSILLGISLSLIFNLPAGALIVISYALVSCAIIFYRNY